MHGDTSQLFTTILLLLGSSTVLITLFYRLRIVPLLAFLIVGTTFGPTGLGLVDDPAELTAIAELGLTFLLFILGLEFSLPRLLVLRKTVFKLGSTQVLACTVFFFLVLQVLTLPWQVALILAGGLSLSSTAIVSRELSSLGFLKKRHGEIAIGILLFQDLAAILLLIAVPLAGNQMDSFSPRQLLVTLLEGLVVLAAFFLTARYLLPRLLQEVATRKSDQLLVLTALVIVLLSATLTSSIGLSMELGAFLAGMMLGDTRFRHQLEADIRPFHDLLLGLFFITIGMLVDLDLLFRYWPYLLVFGLLLVVTKILLISGIVKLLGESWRSAIPSGMALAQGGEFLFALLALLTRDNLITQDTASIIISIVIISMVLTPILVRHGPSLVDSAYLRIGHRELGQQEEAVPAIDHHKKGHILILGFGRVGQTIARFLRPLNIDYLVLETDNVRIAEARAAAEPIYFGDSGRLDILKAADAGSARLVVITFDDPVVAARIVEHLKSINPNVRVLVRTRDDAELDALLAAGAEEVIPETHEASLTLVSHILLMVDYPARMIHSIIDKARRDRYKLLRGFYHGERLGFLSRETGPNEIIHAVRLPDHAWACDKRLGDLSLPLALQVVEIHRGSLIMSAEDREDMLLQPDDVIILRGLVDQLDLGESYLLQG